MKETKGKKYHGDEKIYVIYDEIYDTYIKEKKKKNRYCKILRFLDPSILILKILSEIYDLNDKIAYVSCSSFRMIRTYTYFGEEKKSIYEALLILHSLYKSKLEINNTNIFNSSLITKIDDENIHLYYILNEFIDIYEYFLILHKKCYEHYTRQFFINKDYNLLKGYIKLQNFKNYVSKKHRNISFDTILNKFIKLLNLFTKLKNNYMQLECIVFYVYFYIFLNIPIYFYPWNNISDELNKKIFKDGNVNMIYNVIEKNKNNFFSYILNSTVVKENGYYETYDFNIALFISNEQEKNKSRSLNQDEMELKNSYNNMHCKNEQDFINLNEYSILKNIGYNSLKQFYIPHFYYLTILKKVFVFNNKMKIMQNLFHVFVKYLIKMDKYFKNNIKKEKKIIT